MRPYHSESPTHLQNKLSEAAEAAELLERPYEIILRQRRSSRRPTVYNVPFDGRRRCHAAQGKPEERGRGEDRERKGSRRGSADPDVFTIEIALVALSVSNRRSSLPGN